VWQLFGPAGSGKSTILFQLVQFAKALKVAVLYLPNGEQDGAKGL
jgi:ABC-type cobalamin/Fe3+-siderophores transport system ATPase subunit